MKVFSIFDSIDGEVNFYGQGHPTTFIRLAGCSLRCSFCDTKKARDPASGKDRSVNDVIQDVLPRSPFKVTITGGEPLEQQSEVGLLVFVLHRKGIMSTIETNGAHKIPTGWPCAWVADYKLKGSGMQEHMSLSNFANLPIHSFIKFVVSNRSDYDEAVTVMKTIREINRAKFALSPIMPGLAVTDLITWMQKDRLNSVLLNVQLHKLLNLSEDRSSG